MGSGNAHGEAVATSEKVPKRSPETRKVLTPQVESHLRKEFTKLGIRDSLPSVQTQVRGPGAYWSGVGSPWPLAAAGSRRALASSAPWPGVAPLALV